MARSVPALIVLAAVAAVSTPAAAYVVLPPDASVAGKPIADWTAEWWTWAAQSPAAANPLTDTTGAFAHQNNNGPVFFIGGNLGTSDPIKRGFQVPAGKPLLIPLINLFDVEVADLDPPSATLADREATAEIIVAKWLAEVKQSTLFISIDGTSLPNPEHYLEVTGLFSMGPTQPGSLIESLGVPPGDELYPTKAGGYYVMITGLEPGKHTLHFGGSSDAVEPFDAPIGISVSLPAFTTDTTDTIWVPEPSSTLPFAAGIVGLLGLLGYRRPSRSAR